ncbi:hypothetical protein RND81_09G085000 [Saponaria officinalis]|uniref:Uncharacterized protein n=1 Tax=Saponaria officinalis TaxID=3572 RepID=A0AAW1IK15_SAPOF
MDTIHLWSNQGVSVVVLSLNPMISPFEWQSLLLVDIQWFRLEQKWRWDLISGFDDGIHTPISDLCSFETDDSMNIDCSCRNLNQLWRLVEPCILRRWELVFGVCL